MISWPAKDPVEELDFNWIVPLDEGDAIETFTAVVADGDITIEGTPAFSGATGTAFITGGTADEVATVTLTAVTTGGRTFRDTALLPIIDRASAVLAAFRLRYPVFDTATDGQISYWLADGGSQVSAWREGDQQAGRLAYAAHKLAEAGVGGAGAIPAGVTGFRSGAFSAQVSDAVASRTGFKTTIYGREFLAIAKRNFAGPRLAWTPPSV